MVNELAETLRKGQEELEQSPVSAISSLENSVSASNEKIIQSEKIETPIAEINEVREEIQDEAKEHSKSPEEIFAEEVSEVLLDDKLFSNIRADKKEEFPEELNKFIIENFYNERKDESLDQEKLGKLLLNFYLVYLDDINEFFAAQEAFKDANKLFEHFNKQNV